MRASRADRERVIEALKDAFVQDRLTQPELGTRVGQALASRTYAELAALTADIPAGSAAAEPAARPAADPAPEPSARPAGTPARTLAKAACRSGICMLVAFALVGVMFLAHAEGPVAALAFFSGIAAVIAASGFLGYGVVDAWQQRRSRGEPPRRPRRDGGGLEGGRPGRTGRDLARPGARTDQTRVDLRTHRPGRDQRHPSPHGSRARPPMSSAAKTGLIVLVRAAVSWSRRRRNRAWSASAAGPAWRRPAPPLPH
jgi:Domain of unknown function (DUF1707)